MNRTLIPAGNFEIRSVQGLKESVPGGYIILNGWGVWDKTKNMWLSFGKGIATWRLRKQAVAVIADGLYEGYRVVIAHP